MSFTYFLPPTPPSATPPRLTCLSLIGRGDKDIVAISEFKLILLLRGVAEQDLVHLEEREPTVPRIDSLCELMLNIATQYCVDNLRDLPGPTSERSSRNTSTHTL